MASPDHDHDHPHDHDHDHPHDHGHDHDHDHGHDHAPADDHGHDHGHDHDHGQGAEGGRRELGHGAGVGRVLHLDAFSGVAGDMLVAALLDLGVPKDALARALVALPVRGYELSTVTRTVSGIAALKFEVKVTEPQPSRRWRDLRAMLESAPLLDGVKQRALATFRVLAEAEGRVHRMPPEDVHFHEVGAVDALVDVVSACAALEWLGARVTCAPLPLGRGFVKADHGVLPLPAPAVLEILSGVPTFEAPVECELVTPTGASLVKANAQEFPRWPSIRPVATGFGAGTRTLPDRPNLLRVVLGEPTEAAPSPSQGTHAVLEANLDDQTGQLASHVTEALLASGALDAWTTPLGMKKGRPGVLLSALAHDADRERLARVLLAESGSLGVRWRAVSRYERPRRVVQVATRYGEVPVKVADGDDLPPAAQPEFDVCRELARQHGVPVRNVHAEALAVYWHGAGADLPLK